MIGVIWRLFRTSDEGQDLAESCLITALIALIALGIIFHVSGGLQGMWSTADTALVHGNAASATNGAAGATASQPKGR